MPASPDELEAFDAAVARLHDAEDAGADEDEIDRLVEEANVASVVAADRFVGADADGYDWDVNPDSRPNDLNVYRYDRDLDFDDEPQDLELELAEVVEQALDRSIGEAQIEAALARLRLGDAMSEIITISTIRNLGRHRPRPLAPG